MFAGLDLSPGSSGLVLIDRGGAVSFFDHFTESNTKTDPVARYRQFQRVWEVLSNQMPDMTCIEDYAMGRTQEVSYQIAEVAGLVKYHLYEAHMPHALIHQRKLKSYVVRQRDVDKKVIVAWVEGQGFLLPPRKPGGPGFYQRQREDLADAYVLARIARDLDLFLSEGHPPQDSHILLDPKTGVVFRKDLLFHNPYFSMELHGN